MDDLVLWLGVQLDEDERIAKAAPQGPWVVDGAGSVVDADGGRVIPSVGGARDGRGVRWPEGPVVDHVLGHDPARVLRDIDGKRQMLALHSAPTGHGCSTTDETGYNLNYDEVSPEDACTTLRLLAAPYADRPGFREEWKP